MTWVDANYSHRKKITIDNTLVSGSQIDFPILVNITDADLTSCQVNGYDIKFYESSQTTQLKHDREHFDNSTGNLISWVNVPKISSSASHSGNIIWMYYDYDGTESVDQQDAANTWSSNFRSVWHMSDHPTLSDTIEDFTSYNISCQKGGTVGVPSEVAGKIYKAQAFVSGNKQYLTAFDRTSVYAPTDNTEEITLSVWIKHHGGTAHIIGTDDGTAKYFTHNITATSYPSWTIYDGVDYIPVASPNTVTFDTWYYIVGTIDRTAQLSYIYIDGILVATSADITAVGDMDGNNYFDIGCGYADDPGRRTFFSGNISEVRISDVHRTHEWIWTEYTTASSSTFLSFGSEESYPPIIIGISGCISSGMGVATLSAKITRYSGLCYIYYSANADPNSSNFADWKYSANCGVQYSGANSYFISGVTNLMHSTTYYIRAFVTSNGWGRGQDWADSSLSFTTTPLTVTNAGGATDITSTTATISGEVTSGSGSATFYWGDNDGVTTIANWDYSCSRGLQSSTFASGLTDLSLYLTYYYRTYVSSSGHGYDWAGATSTFSYTLSKSKNLQIYYSSLSTNMFEDVWCTRFDEGNWDVTVEFFCGSSARRTIYDNVTPGAYREIYNILHLPKFIDSTYSSGNTVRFSANTSFNLSNLQETRTVAVKNIQDQFITPNIFLIKIEGIRTDII